MKRVTWAAAVLTIAALGVLATCGNQQECSLNSDCAPGRFCSTDNFCEFQCRTDSDCAGCGICDLRFGICIRSAPPTFTSLGLCCSLSSSMSIAQPNSSAGICVAPDAGTVTPDASPSHRDAAVPTDGSPRDGAGE